MHSTMLRVGASVFLFAVWMPACSDAHGTNDDAGTQPGIDGASVDGGVIIGSDGGGGVVVLVDGALALPDGAITSGDGAVLNPPDGSSGADGSIATSDGSMPHADAGPVAHVGHPCTTDADCPGLFCSTLANGFGYCSWVCNTGMPCPDDAVCHVFTPGSVGYCLARCDPANPMSCSMGYLCEPGVAEAPVCYPGCSTAADCPAGDQCGMGLQGVRSCYTPTAAIGAPCTMSNQCPEAGYCLDEASWGTPHGLCVTFCDLATHAGCGAGTTCVAWGFSGGGAAYGSCIPTCDASTPCRAGYECVSTGSGGPSACVARCMNDGDCTAPHTCNFVTGRCG